MGFLDDLKRQADALRTEQQQDRSTRERHAMLTDAACRTALQYWIQLAPQLNVLRPVSRERFALDTRQVLQGLPRTGFRVDSRRRELHGQEAFDHVVMHWTVSGGRHVVLEKDFVADIERLEGRLQQAGIRPVTSATRDPDNGKLLSMRYEFDDDIACSARLVPDHAHARVQLQLVNLDGLETVRFSLPAVELGSGRLDELARWIVGEPHRCLDGVSDLSRRAPP